jgi:hypothetical protein
MDFTKAIQELVHERDKLDRAIATLEGLANHTPVREGRRGRKTMPPDERRQVSVRMARYWATRRNQREAQASG